MLKTVDIDISAPLTEKQKNELEALRDRPVTYDEDNPPLTDEQLEQLRRIAEARRAARRRENITLRLRPQTIEKAKQLGKGYTRVLSDILEDIINDERTLAMFL